MPLDSIIHLEEQDCIRGEGALCPQDVCPPAPEETAELYLLGHLTPADTAVFEDHYMTCAKCARVVEEANEFVLALLAALRE